MGTSSNPHDAGSPSRYELEREAANTGKSIEQVAAELGLKTVNGVEHKDGVTTTRTKPVEAKPAPKTEPAVKASRRTHGKHQ